MATQSGHAVVMGASMAGLLAARAVSGHFDHVTVVERDALPAGSETRKGVPQGMHAHGLLATGYRVLDRYYPGMFDESVERGGLRGDVTADVLWYHHGHWKLRTTSGLRGIGMSRSLLEAMVRKYTKALPNVRFREGFEAEKPVYRDGQVTGVGLRSLSSGAIETLDADLVVDATGRGSQSPRWLKEWGFASVPESEIQIDVGYATAIVERRPEDLWGASGAIIAGTAPQATRYAAVLAMEGDRWMVTLAGAVGDYPPTDYEGWLEYAKGLPTTDLTEMLSGRQLLGEIQSFRYPANRRRHYDRMPGFPAGYLVIGDALCSFNPIYGQGMSVTASEAQALDECLTAGPDGLWKAFFARTKKITDSPWTIATGEDLKYPQVVGKRPPGFRLVNIYLARVHHACTKDPVVLRQFFEVVNLLAPPTSMMSPRIAWRVAVGGRGQQQECPDTVLA